MPVLVAPVAYQRLVDPEGEAAMARPRRRRHRDVPLDPGHDPARPVAERRPAGRRWFQLYCFSDEAVTGRWMERPSTRASRRSCVTVDAPRGGNRERDRRTGFAIPAGSAFPAFRLRSAPSAR
jgi:4-hydroxymandelate oxidase